ncbi:serine/threonine-protein kinase [Streptomyces sp. NPDC007088]|uniref:serine/threonine-protein kinase n=1 Tax=Streptomyces sp. NPDC007088 TaxID=3364773 RepID=UPI003685825C
MSESEQARESKGRLLAGRYRLGEVLGRGGMGTVWRATDETLGRTVAVKELRFPSSIDDDEKRRLITRTLREAKAIARIRNNGAVTVFDVVDEDDRPWIVMELVEGKSLAEFVREDGLLSPRRAAEVGLAVLDVLRDAHREGILHRDVKPSNVLIAEDGRVVLTDFGIAQVEGDPSVTSTGMLVGAPSYISPERARGHKPGPAADLWSLGGLLYAAVEGVPPYDKGSAIATLTAVMTEPVDPPKHAGPLEPVIYGLLVKDPARRLDDAGARALLNEVLSAPEGAPVPMDRTKVVPLPPAPAAPAAKPARRGWGVGAGAAAGAGAGAGAAAAKSPAAATPSVSGPPRSGTTATAGGGGGAAATRASITDVVPRRTLIAVAVVIVLAIVATVLALTLGGGDEENGKGGKAAAASSAAASDGGADARQGGGQKATDASSAGEKEPSGPRSSPSAGKSGEDENGKSGKNGKDGKDGKNAGDEDGKGDKGGGKGKGADGGKGGDPAAGTTGFRHSQGFSIRLPEGWSYRSTDAAGARFTGPDGQKLLIGWTGTPKSDPVQDWRNQERAMRRSQYQRLRIEKAEFRGWNTADWEFTYTDGGTRFHTVDRGFVVNGSLGYGMMYTARDADWGSERREDTWNTLTRTFEPKS